MTTTLVQTSRRWMVALIMVAVIAVTTTYGPVLLQEVAGVTVATPVYACQAGGGGGC